MKPLPTFEEIKEFIKSKKTVSANKIKNHFQMTGTGEMNLFGPNGKETGAIVAFDINKEFCDHLRNFMKQDGIYCSFSTEPTNEKYTGEKKYIPLMFVVA